jgi:hypothetical protein
MLICDKSIRGREDRHTVEVYQINMNEFVKLTIDMVKNTTIIDNAITSRESC